VIGHLSARHSRRRGLLAVAGVAVATLAWVALSLAGIAAVLREAGELYHWLRLVGAAYLLYAGGRLLVAGARRRAWPDDRVERRPGAPILAGLLTTLSNPKSAVFWTSVFALAVPAHASPGFYVAAVAIIGLQTLAWYGLVAVLFAAPPSRRLYARLARWLDLAAGSVMVGFGLRLAIASEEAP
jgi:threonine efflux protein